MDSPDNARETVRPLTAPAAAPSQLRAALVRPNAANLESWERPEKTAPRFEVVTEPPKRPAAVAGTQRWHRSRAGGRAIDLLRDPRTVREVVIASLMFAPPKGWET